MEESGSDESAISILERFVNGPNDRAAFRTLRIFACFFLSFRQTLRAFLTQAQVEAIEDDVCSGCIQAQTTFLTPGILFANPFELCVGPAAAQHTERQRGTVSNAAAQIDDAWATQSDSTQPH